MLGINCLLNNANIVPNLKQIVEYTGYSLASNNKKPSLQNVYNTLRQSGLEVDIQTVSHVYEDVFDTSNPNFSAPDEIEQARASGYRKIVDKRQQLIKKNEIGKDSPAVAVSRQLANLLHSDLKEKPSVQKIMQERLAKAAKKVLGLKGSKSTPKTSEEVLKEVLQIENANPYYVFGQMENAETLFSELQKEFKELASNASDPYQQADIQQYADILEGAAYKFLLSTNEAQKIITDTLKESGYTRQVNVNGGTKELIDWNKIISSNVDFRKTISDVFAKKGFSENNIERIQDQLSDEYNELKKKKAETLLEAANKRVEPRTATQKAAMDKMLSLYNYGIFDNVSQEALMKMLGVSEMTANSSRQMQDLMKQYNEAMATPMAKWSPTYVKTLQREIENIIERIEERDGKLRAIRLFGFFQQLNSAAILANLQNVSENITSNFVEILLTAVRSPKQAFEAAKIFTTVLSDIIQGGVREGSELSNAFNTSGNLEERYNFETAKTLPQKIVAGISSITRVALSSVDNAGKAAISHLLTLSTLSKTLQAQGLTRGEANIAMNQMYYGNKEEVEALAKQLESNLTAAGIRTAKGKWKRLASELSKANMLSDGQFFKDTIDRLQREGKIENNKTATINEDVLNAIRNAAETTASKGLGHQADSKALELLDKISGALGQQVQNARNERDKVSLRNAEMQRTVYGMINRFRSGAMRWLWLSFQKSSGIALMQTLVTDVVMNKGKNLKFPEIDYELDNQQQIEEDLTRYLSLRQRLVRQTVTPIISYVIGSQLILPMVMAAFGFGGGSAGDNDDDDYADFSKWIQDDPARRRWFQKMLPVLVYAYLANQTTKGYGEVKTKKDAHKPAWTDLISPDIALEAILNNYNQSSIAQAFVDVQREKAKGEKGQVGVVGGKFVGNVLNVGGIFRNYNINKDAIDILNGQSNKLSKKEYKAISPEDFWDGFLYSSLGQQMYRTVTDK